MSLSTFQQFHLSAFQCTWPFIVYILGLPNTSCWSCYIQLRLSNVFVWLISVTVKFFYTVFFSFMSVSQPLSTIFSSRILHLSFFKVCLGALCRAVMSWLYLLEKFLCHYCCSFFNISIPLSVVELLFFNQLLGASPSAAYVPRLP